MSDEVETEEPSEEENAPVKSKKKLFIMIGAAVFVLLAGGGAGFYFLAMTPGSTEGEMVAEAKPSFYYDLPTMVVNLNGSNDEFLKVSVSLELENEAMVEEIKPRMTRVVDAFQVYLRELRKSDLDGSAGIYRLKEELRRRVNLAIAPMEVSSILFREILVQ